MRGGFVRGGHSHAHDPRRKAYKEQILCVTKKGRKEGEGSDFSGYISLVPREEEWMRSESEEGRKGEAPRRSFCDAMKGGRLPVAMKEDDSFLELDSSEEKMENNGKREEKTKCKEKGNGPDIRIEKAR
ncbi:hypothetical protein AHAS_Ahas13G0255900 [Arachis hypogaea]